MALFTNSKIKETDVYISYIVLSVANFTKYRKTCNEIYSTGELK